MIDIINNPIRAEMYSLGVQAVYKRIKERLNLCLEELDELQNTCEHINVTKKSDSDTGNWDRSQDYYRYECKCPDCGKQWSEDQ